ncbi:methyl-accepting chemotaxis protein [Marinomonas spartinae]|uniref:methyl-accepting chemotaxis protein n=1 Tax=Marinomonas spartinae TaxID=1792290 RepID=UPI0018F2418B|nr:methyl-accepting chemotaxis protein [Marinomonas spartinae]MBJ7555981.1 methyl-accepting chemotaxis protein [Marinomonas spartinae]
MNQEKDTHSNTKNTLPKGFKLLWFASCLMPPAVWLTLSVLSGALSLEDVATLMMSASLNIIVAAYLLIAYLLLRKGQQALSESMTSKQRHFWVGYILRLLFILHIVAPAIGTSLAPWLELSATHSTMQLLVIWIMGLLSVPATTVPFMTVLNAKWEAHCNDIPIKATRSFQLGEKFIFASSPIVAGMILPLATVVMVTSESNILGTIGVDVLKRAIPVLFITSSVAVLSIYLMIRTFRKELSVLKESVAAMSNGDLSYASPPSSRDEVGLIMEHFGESCHRLRNLLNKVIDNVHATKDASSNISTLIENVRNAGQQQIGRSEQTSVATEELTSQFQHIRDNSQSVLSNYQHVQQQTKHVSKEMDTCVESFKQLGEILQNNQETMKSLNTQGSSVKGIVETINAIAEQTNLLALNAAIEAARAGEQGRGFAVVADEVRHLAKRTAESTHEIESQLSTLLGSIVDAVKASEEGHIILEKTAKEIGNSGHLMLDIEKSSSTVLDAIEQITQTLNEQAQAVSSIAEVTVESSNDVKHSNEKLDLSEKATQNLNRLCEELNQQVEIFKLA